MVNQWCSNVVPSLDTVIQVLIMIMIMIAMAMTIDQSSRGSGDFDNYEDDDHDDWLSVALRIWNIWQCKGVVLLNFDQMRINEILTGQSLPKYPMKIPASDIHQKIWRYGQKTWRGGAAS